MSFREAAGVWAAQVRAPFLVLSVLLVAVGGAASYRDGRLDVPRLLLTMVGVTLAHVAVNLYNEYSDHRTGIDARTPRTPFSGGSGTLQAGRTRPGEVKAAAFGALATAFLIGLYLTWVSGWPLLIFILLGGLTARFYTSHLARWVLGELAAGICLGTLVVLGAYYVQNGVLTSSVVWLSVPPGILTSLLLFLNELPDLDADLAGGRRHLVIVLGRRRAAVVYTAVLVVNYLVLVTVVAVGALPATVLLALLTLPLAVKAARGALRHAEDVDRLVPALGANVGVVLGTNLLLALACFL